MIEKISLYLVTLLVYLPWLIYAIKTKKISQYPIVSFCFIGLFFFNAVGSIFVMFPDFFTKGGFFIKNLFSYDYVLMLIIQALIFYAVTSIYFYFNVQKVSKKIQSQKAVDKIFRYILVTFVTASLVFFLLQVGSPPLIEILRGNLDSFEKIISYRTNTIYSTEYGSIAIVSLYFLPLLTAIYIFVESSLKKKRSYYDYLLIVCCIVISALPGGKGNILDLVTALFIAYLLLRTGAATGERKPIAYKQLFLWLSVSLVPVALLYNIYYSSTNSTFEKFQLFVYRIFGAYSEIMAATVPYTESNGFLGGITLPRFKGLIHSEEPINLSAEMFKFLYGSSGGAPVSACAEGYINFGWFGFILMTFIIFIIVVLIQEFLRQMPQKDLLTFSLMVIYSLFATKISQISLLAYILEPNFTLIVLLMLTVRYLLVLLCSEIRIQKTHLRSQK